MSGGDRFALRLPWMPGEPAHGYLKRVATRYGSSARALGARFGIDERGLTRGLGIERLAQLGRVEAAPMIAASPIVRARDRRVDLAGEQILLSDWSTSSRRWCAACLEGDAAAGQFGAYQRYWWDVASIAVCHVHSLRMSAACGWCGQLTTWADHTLDRCACGRRLAGTASVDATPAASAAFSRYIAGRVGASQIDRDHPVADRIPLFQLPKLTTRVGIALAGRWAPSPPEATDLELEALRGAGLACLDDPGPPFLAALDKMIAGRDGRPAGLIGAYGWIYSHWLSFPDQDPTQLFAMTLREHAVANEVVSVEEPVLGLKNQDTLSLTGLANRLGMGFDRTRRIVLSQGVIGKSSRRGVALPIAEEAAQALVDARSNGMLVRDVGAMLGVGKRIVAELTDAKLLKRSTDGRYGRHEVEGFAQQLSRGSVPTGRIVSLTSLARSGAGTVAELCSEVLAGTLEAAPLSVKPVRLAEVGLASEQVAERRGGPPLTIRAIARRLGLREDVTSHLAETGVLSDTASSRPTPAGIGLFERDFVTTVELSRRCGLSSRGVWVILRNLDVVPAFGPPDCRQLIYRRSDAERALSSYMVAQGGMHAARNLALH